MRSRELTAAAMNRIRTLAGIIGMIVLMLLGAACSGNGGITVEDVTGTWEVTTFGSYAQFNEDGTYSIARTIGALETGPLDVGQWTLEGALITYIASDESAVCTAGDRGIYEVELTDESRMTHVRQEDACSVRSGETINFERVP